MTEVPLQTRARANLARYSDAVRRPLIACVALASAAWIYAVPSRPAPRQLPGWPLYDRYCLPCHGAAGDGRGPAAPYTRGDPRDFTKGNFEWRSAQAGATDDDLRLTLRHGAPGTSMPGFALADAQIDQLIEVVRAFGPPASPGQPIVLAQAKSDVPGATLWTKYGCVACHGNGDGKTPSSKAMAEPPYDLTRELRRPRATDTTEARRAAIAMSIATGMAGSPMPGYRGAISDGEIWALADYVLSLRVPSAPDRSVEDHGDNTPVGVWPGNDAEEGKLFGGPIAPQGTPPVQLAPAQASLGANQCARCHNKQFREWQTSLHHAATSPGLAAQMWTLDKQGRAACQRCHAPLAEQRDDAVLYADGASCAGCHVRGWTRHGPPNIAPSLMTQANYPLTTLAIYERADFCLPCHQLPSRTAVAGRPLLDTYREWLEGPYMPRGIQCQHCHMPNREHTWKGVHDQQTFKEAIALTATASSKAGAVTVVAELANIGAGHYLPTTPTPAAWLSIRLLDRDGKQLATEQRQRIGRDIYYDTQWHERADTRIPPGEKLTMSRAWSKLDGAAIARITVEVHPDDYYERLYEGQLQHALPAGQRKSYEEALARARSRHYIAEQRDFPIAR
jgi:mono/diheme cytochrome c family protein